MTNNDTPIGGLRLINISVKFLAAVNQAEETICQPAEGSNQAAEIFVFEQSPESSKYITTTDYDRLVENY